MIMPCPLWGRGCVRGKPGGSPARFQSARSSGPFLPVAKRGKLQEKKSPILLDGGFLFLERATRLELASRHPTNGLRPFAGTLPPLGLKTRFARGWRQRVLLPVPNRSPAERVRFGSEEKVRPAHEKSPKAFFIALGLFLSWSGQRGSNSLPPPWQGGALPDELCPREQGVF